MAKRLVLSTHNTFRLLLAAVAFFLFFSAFAAYSVTRYKGSMRLSPLKGGNVQMRVIQHGVKCVCPRCAFKGVPSCPQCMVEMYWNGYKGTFVCPACGKGGFPLCQHCGDFMTWIELK